MIFEIDADIVYSRGCAAKIKWFESFATQYMVIRPSKPLYFRLSGEEICAVINDTDDLNTFFSASKKRSPIFTLYHQESDYRNFSSSEEYEKNVPECFTGLNFEEFRSEFLWKKEDILPAWEVLLNQYDDLAIDRDEAYTKGFRFPDQYCEEDILPFEEFKSDYIKSRDFEITEDVLSTDASESNGENLTFIRATGGWASGVWYPDDFLLHRFKNIRSIKVVSKNSTKIKITSLSQIQKIAMTEALENFGDEKELAEHIESQRDRLFNITKMSSKSDSSGCLGLFLIWFLLPLGIGYGIAKWLF
tara:strand:- start:1652 stop:2563 length:912 start_codon:yes stop_codon:yes gene_type:complete